MEPEPFTWGEHTFRLYDVAGDHNCFYYALLRATSDKNLPPGRGWYRGCQKKGKYEVHDDGETKLFIVGKSERAGMLKCRNVVADRLESYDMDRDTNGVFKDTAHVLVAFPKTDLASNLRTEGEQVDNACNLSILIIS